MSSMSGVLLWAVFALIPQLGFAQGCSATQEIAPTDRPPELAARVRTCIQQGQFELAMAHFYAFSSHALFDQQRVKDESAHVVVRELQGWMFGGWSAAQMEGLGAVAAALRDPKNDLLNDVCAQLQANGPPTYEPGYMIIRGMVPRKNSGDWHHQDFDPTIAWRRALHELNNCPGAGDG